MWPSDTPWLPRRRCAGWLVVGVVEEVVAVGDGGRLGAGGGAELGQDVGDVHAGGLR
jgi:hypothetical protein